MKVSLKPIAHQIVVVMQAASGIGLAVAREAAARGARLVLVDPDAGALTRVADELGGRGARVVTIEAALDEPGEARRVVQVAEAAYGGFDTVVISPPVLLAGAAGLDDRRLFDRLYWSVADCATEAARHLRRRGGALVLVGLAVADPARRTPVRAARGAIDAFAAGLRGELADLRAPVGVTLVTPGAGGAYDPALVARAALFAAEHPRRRLVVGAAGFAAGALGEIAPGLARRRGGAQPARDTSYALEAQLHPAAAAAIAAGAGFVLAGIAYALARATARPQGRRARRRPWAAAAPDVQDARYDAWRSARPRRSERAALHPGMRSGQRVTLH